MKVIRGLAAALVLVLSFTTAACGGWGRMNILCSAMMPWRRRQTVREGHSIGNAMAAANFLRMKPLKRRFRPMIPIFPSK